MCYGELMAVAMGSKPFIITCMILKWMTVAIGLVNITYSQCEGLGVQNLHTVH
jgi:hypothetical protein